MLIKITLDLDLYVPDSEKKKQVWSSQIHVVQELMDKLYLGKDYYPGDVFSVVDLHMSKFSIETADNNGTS